MSLSKREQLVARKRFNKHRADKLVEEQQELDDKLGAAESDEEDDVEDEEEMFAVKRLRGSASTMSLASHARTVPREPTSLNIQKTLLKLQARRLRLEAEHLEAERAHLKKLEEILDKESELEAALSRTTSVQPPYSSLPRTSKAKDASGARALDDTSTAALLTKPERRKLILFFDGASKRNPGPSGAGWILTSALDGAGIALGWKFLGDHSTNNEAEYAALLEGLQYVKVKNIASEAEVIHIQGDSNLVVNQVQNAWKCKAANLMPFLEKAQSALAGLSTLCKVKVEHIPREQNSLADFLSNVAVAQRTQAIHSDLKKSICLDDLRKRFG